jgi:choline dehydrogenase
MEFDYVIIGAGSAGCVLANRLSADKNNTVALLEAGGVDSYPWIHIPVGYFKTMGNPRTDWSYKTEHDAGLNGRSITWPRGKVLGGSSSINGLLYVRGQALDYDGWRQLGNAGWAWEDVLPYFKRAETYDQGGDEHRGASGPLSVSASRVKRDIIDAWIEAANQAGFRTNDDYNGAEQEGVGYFQMTMRDGRRCSAAVAYLHPVDYRSNLTVLTKTPAQRLILEGKRVVGVEALVDGEKVTVRARKEVILSAGAIASPQLLMVSGIGGAAQLSEHDIEVRHELRGVGQNLQDHLQARPVYRCTASTINVEVNSLFKQAVIGARYMFTRTGPMAMAASLGAGFVKSRPELESPDIQFHVQPFSKSDMANKDPDSFSAFTMSVLQLRPESTGEIKLKSPHMADYPAIHPNYLATRNDQNTIVAGIRVARDIAECEPLSSLITAEHAPGPSIASDDYDGLLNWARDTATTIFHPTGTCKMGNDEAAVVDDRLRVHGLAGLRIADCSIMPRIVSGNTNAPAIMIGEKAADMILAEHK